MSDSSGDIIRDNGMADLASRRGSPRLLWVGPTCGPELGLAHAGLSAFASVTVVDRPPASGPDDRPTWALIASDRPGRFTMADAVALSRRWPLMPIVSVATTLVDGRRRSGPQLQGIEEVPWYDLPGRCRWWHAALEAGLPSGLVMPATARREERLLESFAAIRSRTLAGAALPALSVAAAQPVNLEGLCDLLATAGYPVAHRTCGRPRIDETAQVIIWDVDDITAEQLAWLRLLAANRPGVTVVVLESFPRGDAALAAVRAGATTVLGRPVSLEALAGTLLGR